MKKIKEITDSELPKWIEENLRQLNSNRTFNEAQSLNMLLEAQKQQARKKAHFIPITPSFGWMSGAIAAGVLSFMLLGNPTIQRLTPDLPLPTIPVSDTALAETDSSTTTPDSAHYTP